MNDDFEIIGRSKSLLNLLEVAKRVASTEATVLLQGESGTGKELFARFIQNNSRRKEKRFVAINCAAIPDNLLESELFGYKAGSFTDAKNDYIGKFGYANLGTIFLDEIGEMSLPLQAKLLRVLQNREYEQIGNPEPLKVDVRIITATNKNLYSLVTANKFREDLYYRLNIIPLTIPPLRERKDDIELLSDYYLKLYNSKNMKKILGFNRDAVDFLVNYSWPGNVRELQNLIERAVIIAQKEYIGIEDIHLKIDDGIENKKEKIISLKDAINSFKKDYIIFALSKNNWNQTSTAKKLGIQRTYLARLVKELNIDKK